MPAGEHRISWDGTNDAGVKVGSGVYLYRLRAENFSSVKKMLFLK